MDGASSALRTSAAGGRCHPILKFAVRGGLNNQKECLVNAGIVARALNVTLALPHFNLVGHGNEQFEPANAKYIGPYADRDRWGHFGHIFNATWLLSTLEPSLSLLVRTRPAVGGGRPYIVRLPSIANVSRGCEGFMKWQDTCEAMPRDKRLLDMLIEDWRRVITRECSNVGGGTSGIANLGSNGRRLLDITSRPSSASSPSEPPDGARNGAIVFDAGRSLCWNTYKSRHATTCVEQYPFCAKMLRALRWNRVISRLQQRVLRGIARQRANVSGVRLTDLAQGHRAGWATSGWAAVHVRAFVCARNKRDPSFAHVAPALAKLGVRSGFLYVVSSVPVELVAAALPQFTVIGKTSFLGRDARLKYPFEVLAAVDYGIAVSAPLYLGEPQMSSFDAFIEEDRQRHNRSVDLIPGICGTGAGPGA